MIAVGVAIVKDAAADRGGAGDREVAAGQLVMVGDRLEQPAGRRQAQPVGRRLDADRVLALGQAGEAVGTRGVGRLPRLAVVIRAVVVGVDVDGDVRHAAVGAVTRQVAVMVLEDAAADGARPGAAAEVVVGQRAARRDVTLRAQSAGTVHIQPATALWRSVYAARIQRELIGTGAVGDRERLAGALGARRRRGRRRSCGRRAAARRPHGCRWRPRRRRRRRQPCRSSRRRSRRPARSRSASSVRVCAQVAGDEHVQPASGTMRTT